MATTLQKQIAEMETRCAQLEELQKLFEKMVKNEFGIDAKKIHKLIGNDASAAYDFQQKIGSYFSLKTPEDFDDFLRILCTESSLNYFEKKCSEEYESADRG